MSVQPLVWERTYSALPHWFTAEVIIAGEPRRISLAQVREQPQYWKLYRGDGNDGLIIGPTDEYGAKRFADEWLTKQEKR